MKHVLLYIGILFCSLSCSPKGFHPATGDLLFQANDSSAMVDAITASTGRELSLKFSHAAIAVRFDNADSVLEASGEGGVRMVSLEEFLNASATTKSGHAVVVMRLRDTMGVAASVERARSLLGQPYDYSYLPDNGKIYCSELVWESYRRPDSHRIFTARPMNFRDKEGNLPAFWEDLFHQLGEPVPEGVPGTNPADMSKEEVLTEVHSYL